MTTTPLPTSSTIDEFIADLRAFCVARHEADLKQRILTASDSPVADECEAAPVEVAVEVECA